MVHIDAPTDYGNYQTTTSYAARVFEIITPGPTPSVIWVAVKELNSSYYIRETLLFTIYTHYGNLI